MKKKMPREKVFEYIEEDYIMMDKRGRWWAQEECPALNRSSPVCWTGGICFPLYIAIDYDGPWEDSLMERPGQEVMWRLYNSDNALALVIFRGGNPPAGGRKSELPELAPPEVAAWFHRVMEETEK